MDLKNFGMTLNGRIFHEIGDYSFGENQNGDFFHIRRDTPVVITPGSDMPFIGVKWYPDENSIAGWPSQVPNPAIYKTLFTDDWYDDNVYSGPVVFNHVIILSHIPTILKPGVYVPCMPIMAYIGNQWDLDHDLIFTSDILEVPKVHLMESNYPVEQSNYSFVIKEIIAGVARIFQTPWLKVPMNRIATDVEQGGLFNKLLGVGISNMKGDPTGPISLSIHTKNLMVPDFIGGIDKLDTVIMPIPGENSKANTSLERYGWFKLEISIDPDASLPHGIGIIIE